MAAARDLDNICLPAHEALSSECGLVEVRTLSRTRRALEALKSPSRHHAMLLNPSSSDSQASLQTSRGICADIEHTEKKNKIYPEAPNTVWHVYLSEASRADSAMLDEWNRSIDVLLVFTGLFSAVVTTFVVEAYKDLINDPIDTTNTLLARLELLLQRHNGTGISFTMPSTNPAAPPSIRAYWVNALWFASLSCSLSTGFISMLAKHWLQYLTPLDLGSAHERVRHRQQRLMRLKAWFIPNIVDALPICLHFALFLFFAGLIALLWPISFGISMSIAVLVVVIFGFYILSIILSTHYSDCPYRHPLSGYLRLGTSSKTCAKNYSFPSLEQANIHLSSDVEKDGCPPWPWRTASRSFSGDELDASALSWLFTESPDQNTRSSALIAIADLPRNFSAFEVLRRAGALELAELRFAACFRHESISNEWHVVDAASAAQYCRVWLSLARGTAACWPASLMEPVWLLACGSPQPQSPQSPDACAMAHCVLARARSHLPSSSDQVQSLVGCLDGHLSGKLQPKLSRTSQLWLLDTLIECSPRIGTQQGPYIRNRVLQAGDAVVPPIPTLLGVLRLAQESQPIDPEICNASSLALYTWSCGPVDDVYYKAEENREKDFLTLVLRAFSAIIGPENPSRIDDLSLDYIARFTANLVSSENRSHAPEIDTLLRICITEMFASGRYARHLVPDSVLSELLRVLCTSSDIPKSQQAACITSSIRILRQTSDPGVLEWSLRFLEHMLTDCSLLMMQSFVGSNGIDVVLRFAKGMGDTAHGVEDTLQQVAVRVLLAFVRSSSAWRESYASGEARAGIANARIEMILRIDFLAFVVQTWISPYESVQSGTNLVYV
ncbi:hypothetical protein HGRIS_002800 [Hohenbuehelia grisea]|uniref:DUF6535 domain-containing protein n=1 Tax=Hohenbuehelia grisea TaxID=104357 RepID=A0ABR3JLK7_9AGAR